MGQSQTKLPGGGDIPDVATMTASTSTATIPAKSPRPAIKQNRPKEETTPKNKRHQQPQDLTPSSPDVEGGGKDGSITPTSSLNRTKRKLFRRQSSKRVFPDDAGEVGTNESGPASPSPTDNKKNMLMFSGTMVPVPYCEVPEAKEGFLSATQLYNSLNDGQLSPLKYDPTFMLIVDTRSKADYHEKHIVLSRHVSELRDGPDMEPLDAYTLLILYDHKGLSHSIRDSVLATTVRALRNEGLNPFILTGGYDKFHKDHPYLCTSKVATSGPERHRLIPCCYPSIIVPESLYLGRGDQATNLTIVTNLRITHIINVTREHPNAFRNSGKIKYLKIALDDDSLSDLSVDFPECIEFINEAVNSGGRLMVHCNLGMSRSSTVLMAYLMYTHKWILRDAYCYLKERRPIVRPNSSFMRQLESFEIGLFGKKFTDISQMSGHRSYGQSR